MAASFPYARVETGPPAIRARTFPASVLPPPPPTPAGSLPWAPGAGAGPVAAPGPSRRGCHRPAPRGQGMRSRPREVPLGESETRSGRLPPGQGRRWRRVSPHPQPPPLAAHPRAGGHSGTVRRSAALALALGEFGDAASPLLPHPSRRRTCYHVLQINNGGGEAWLRRRRGPGAAGGAALRCTNSQTPQPARAARAPCVPLRPDLINDTQRPPRPRPPRARPLASSHWPGRAGAGRHRRRRLAGGESVSMFKPRREVNRGSRRAELGERGAARWPRECCSEGGEEGGRERERERASERGRARLQLLNFH